MKLPVISLIASAGFLTLVSCTTPLAANTSTLEDQAFNQIPHPEIERNFQGDIPFSDADTQTATLLKSIQNRFEEPPFDGTFGMGRAVMIDHNINMLNPDVDVDGHRALAELEKDYSLYILSFSTPYLRDNSGRIAIAPVATYTKNPNAKENTDGLTRSLNGKYYTVDYRQSKHSGEEYKKNQEELTTIARAFLNGKENYQLTHQGDNPKQIVELQKIYSTGDNCLKCHQNIQPDQPIGVIGIQRIPLETLKDR